MSEAEIELCTLLLKEHFGEIVKNIGVSLMKTGSRPLHMIVRNSKCTLQEVKNALCILLQHNMAGFSVHERGYVEYDVYPHQILLLLRYPRYIYIAKTLYGDIAELLVEEILAHGQLQMSSVIQKVTIRLKEATQQVSVNQVRERFVRLVETQFLQRCPSLITPEDEKQQQPAPAFAKSDKDLYTVPDIFVHLISNEQRADESEGPPVKRVKVEEKQPDLDIYWKVNFTRFHQYMRDLVIVSAVKKRIDNKAGEIVRTLLRLAETRTLADAVTTNPVYRTELLEKLKTDTKISGQELDPYLSLLMEDSCRFISKADERSGGLYVLNTSHALRVLAESTIVSIVQDRFGSKCCRIFRLLLAKKYLEQKQIEELAMIPAKDAKQYTYRMLQESFITTKEIPKTPDHAPSRTYFLFCVDLDSVTRMLKEWCYKFVQKAMCRREFETKEHKRVLEKKQRVDAIIATLQQNGTDPTQVQEVEDMITPPEKAELAKVKHVCDKLDRSELQTDETIFILNMWIDCDKRN